MNPTIFYLAVAGLILAPLVGGLVSGVDRVVTARLQSRVGPPLLQPFYDAGKLWSKSIAPTSNWQGMFVRFALFASLVTDMLLVAGCDLLLCFFVQAASASFIVVGAYCGMSPYSRVGAQRELFQLACYEPMFLLIIMGLYKASGGGLDVYSIMAASKNPLLFKLWFLLPAMVFVLLVKMRKSPFDISTSEHAHQELVRGMYTDYAGRDLALLEIAHWADLTVVLWIFALLWATGPLQMVVTGLIFLFVALIIDNTSARLTWRYMVKVAAPVSILLATANLLWLYLE